MHKLNRIEHIEIEYIVKHQLTFSLGVSMLLSKLESKTDAMFFTLILTVFTETLNVVRQKFLGKEARAYLCERYTLTLIRI